MFFAYIRLCKLISSFKAYKMVFKLIRIDTVSPLKIQLNPGNHRLGRGADIFECEDKRVSRNHGELIVTDDAVVLKSLHSNPCFYTKKHLPDTQMLTINTDVELTHGDKFGLLPDLYWYELIHCTETGPVVAAQNVTHEFSNVTDETNVVSNGTNETNVVSNGTTENVTVKSEDIEITDEVAEAFEQSLDDTVSDLNRSTSPSLIPPAQSSQPNTQEYQVDSTVPNQPLNSDEITRTPVKREPDNNEDIEGLDVKRIKTEHDVKSEGDQSSTSGLNAVPQAPRQGPSNDQVPPPNPNPTHRERCMYGAQCYRKNPQHKAQFSHPGDGDWGSEAQIPCPWGAQCTRTDPRHFRDHSHPDNMGPNRRGKAKRPRKKAQSDDSDREASPVPDLNLPAKRVRKTVKRQSWSGDESENEDPFLTDGSDEWTPNGKDENEEF